MAGYIAVVQVSQEYHVPVKAKDEDAAFDKVQALIDKGEEGNWKKYAVESEDFEPEVSLLEVNESDSDTDEFAKWVR